MTLDDVQTLAVAVRAAADDVASRREVEADPRQRLLVAEMHLFHAARLLGQAAEHLDCFHAEPRPPQNPPEYQRVPRLFIDRPGDAGLAGV